MSGAAFRRGACPSLPAPMATGDGLLARLAPALPLTPHQLEGLAGLARDLGNGIVEVTARGKLQLRGLTLATAPLLPAAIDVLGIEVHDGLAVETGALAGLDPTAAFDPRPLADAIANGGANLADRLAPKVSVVVDGGGALHLRALAADIAVRAAADGSLLLVLAGRACARVAPDEAASVVLTLLERLAALGPGVRMDALVASENRDVLRGRLGLEPPGDLADLPQAEPVGLHPLAGGKVALGVGLAFGQCDAGALQRFAQQAGAAGAEALVPAAGRALIALGLMPAAASALREAAATLGFITAPDDARRRIAACPGAPACASGRLPARALAMQIAAMPATADRRSWHVSGCAKGCAQAGPAGVTLVGLDEGVGIVVEGGSRDAPVRVVPAAGLSEALREMFGEHGV